MDSKPPPEKTLIQNDKGHTPGLQSPLQSQNCGAASMILDSRSEEPDPLEDGDEHTPLLHHNGRPKVPQSQVPRMGTCRIWKNLLCLSTANLLVCTSFGSLQNLQSTLNLSSGLGVTAMACLYGGMVISSLYTPVLIRLLGSKWVVLMLLMAQTLYAAAHFWRTFYTLVPAASLCGLVASPAMAAMFVYISNIAREYSSVNKTGEPMSVITWFSGIFLGFYQMNQVIGNLISSTVLQTNVNEYSAANGNTSDLEWETCGAKFCLGDNLTDSANFQQPPDRLVDILVSIFLACCMGSILIVLLAVDRCRDLETATSGDRSCVDDVLGTVLAHRHPGLTCLVPLFLWTGAGQAFMFSEYNQAFVGCQMGIGYVGYVMVGFGAAAVTGSFMVGRIARYSGRPVFMLCAAAINLALLLVMLFWKPSNGPDALHYVIAVLWGLGDGIWQTVTTALIGTEFPGVQESAFSMFRMWQAAGFTFLFAISQFLCMDVKIYITLSLLVLTVSLYLVAEIVIRRRNSTVGHA